MTPEAAKKAKKRAAKKNAAKKNAVQTQTPVVALTAEVQTGTPPGETVASSSSPPSVSGSKAIQVRKNHQVARNVEGLVIRLRSLRDHTKSAVAWFLLLRGLTGFRFHGTAERFFADLVKLATTVAERAQNKEHVPSHILAQTMTAAERVDYLLGRTFANYVKGWSTDASRLRASIQRLDAGLLDAERSKELTRLEDALQALVGAEGTSPAEITTAYNALFTFLRGLNREATESADASYHARQQDEIASLGGELDDILKSLRA